jgi:hypothetical protein
MGNTQPWILALKTKSTVNSLKYFDYYLKNRTYELLRGDGCLKLKCPNDIVQNVVSQYN